MCDRTMRLLEEMTVRNFKSIQQQRLKLGRMNVFIGAMGPASRTSSASFISSTASSRLIANVHRHGGGRRQYSVSRPEAITGPRRLVGKERGWGATLTHILEPEGLPLDGPDLVVDSMTVEIEASHVRHGGEGIRLPLWR